MLNRSSAAQVRHSRPVSMFERVLPVVELQWQDATGSKGTTTVKAPLDTARAILDVDALSLASFIAPITGCVLTRIRVLYKAVAVPRTDAITGTSVISAGMFFFESADGVNQLLFQVPGILDSKLVSSGDGAGVLIDVTDSDVIALIEQFQSLDMCNPFGVVCDALVTAYRQSRL